MLLIAMLGAAAAALFRQGIGEDPSPVKDLAAEWKHLYRDRSDEDVESPR